MVTSDGVLSGRYRTPLKPPVTVQRADCPNGATAHAGVVYSPYACARFHRLVFYRSLYSIEACGLNGRPARLGTSYAWEQGSPPRTTLSYPPDVAAPIKDGALRQDKGSQRLPIFLYKGDAAGHGSTNVRFGVNRVLTAPYKEAERCMRPSYQFTGAQPHTHKYQQAVCQITAYHPHYSSRPRKIDYLSKMPSYDAVAVGSSSPLTPKTPRTNDIDPTEPIPVDYIISLLPSAPPSPTAPTPPSKPSPSASPFFHTSTHTVHPDPTFTRLLSASSLSPAARAQAMHQARQVGDKIARAIKEEEEAQLSYGMDSRTDAGFGRVMRAAQGVREEVNAAVCECKVKEGEGEGEGTCQGNARKDRGTAAGEGVDGDGCACPAVACAGGQGGAKAFVRSFKYIDERQ